MLTFTKQSHRKTTLRPLCRSKKRLKPTSRRRVQAAAEVPRNNSLRESQHSPSPLKTWLSHAASEVTQHRVANADRHKTVSQKANTDPLPLKARRHHAALELTQQRVVATADDPCFGVGCQPLRQNNLPEGQNLEVHHVMPLNGGVAGAAWAPAGMAIVRAHATRYDVLPVPSVFPSAGASRFCSAQGLRGPRRAALRP